MEKSLYQWLDKIEARPGLYLRNPGFASLTSFIAGFEIALTSHHISDYAEPALSAFALFVSQRLGCDAAKMEIDLPGSASWERCILAKSVDDSEAFKMFFALLREFQAGGPRQ